MTTLLREAGREWQALLDNERRLGLVSKWFLTALGILLWLISGRRPLVAIPPWPLLIYGIATLFFTVQWLRPVGRPRQLGWLLAISNVFDVLFVGYLIADNVALADALALLYGLVALKVALTLPGAWAPPLVAALCGPSYIAASYWARRSLAFLVDPAFLLRYLALAAVTLVAAVIGRVLAQRRQRISNLDAALKRQEADLAQKTQVLQRTATDLGARVLELRALHEMARTLSSTLHLEETLQLIVNRLADLSDSSHCGVALLDRSGRELVGAAASGLDGDRFKGLRLPAGGMSDGEEHRPASNLALADNATLASGRTLSLLGEIWDSQTCLVTPLVVRDHPIGALYLADTGADTVFGEQARRLVSSFAYFAATAIENARLYQQAWEKSQELETVLQSIGDGVLVVDAQQQLLLMNDVAERIFVEPTALSRLLLSETTSDNPMLELLEQTLQARDELIREIELPDPGGRDQARTYQALASPLIAEDGRVQGAVAVLRDITGQKELERMKSNFLSVVSHELKTPLHSIKGFVEIILMGKTGTISDLQRDFLSTVKQQTDHLQRQINDLLEYSRLESGQVKLFVEEVDMLELVGRVLGKLAPLAQERELTLGHHLADGGLCVEGDRLRLEQVLTNLVENGIKFTPPGGEVTVEASDLGDQVQVTVCDTGVGVQPAERERIFDRFYQVDSSAQRPYRGAGLGLTICRHIVAHHGGHIWVDDNQPQGSRFHFVLPKQLAVSEAPLDFTSLPSPTR